MESRVFENFQNNQKICKIPKVPKIVLKSIQTCFEPILGQMFRNFFSAVFDGGSRLRKISKKNPKKFKIAKMPKIVPKSIQTSFERVLGQTFRKIFAQFSMEGRVFENFQKSQKLFKFPKTFKISKMPKVGPKISKRILNVFWGKFFEKFLPSFPRMVDS